MTSPQQTLRKGARRLSAAGFPGTARSFYPFWDTSYRPYLIEIVRGFPAEHFDFKPRPEAMTARQVALHIAEGEAWWISHHVNGEAYEDYVTAKEDPSQGFITVPDAPDADSMIALLTEAHLPTQRWLDQPADSLSREFTDRTPGADPDRHWSLHWILDHVQEHEIHHRAQLLLYLRLLGLEPPRI